MIQDEQMRESFASIVSNQDLMMYLGTRKITQISCGHFHTLALESDGTLWSWAS